MGKSVYRANCTGCHGKDGGPTRDRWAGKEPFKNGDHPSDIYRTIKSGYGPMPSFKRLPNESRWGLAYYIRSFNPKNPEHKHVR